MNMAYPTGERYINHEQMGNYDPFVHELRRGATVENPAESISRLTSTNDMLWNVSGDDPGTGVIDFLFHECCNHCGGEEK